MCGQSICCFRRRSSIGNPFWRAARVLEEAHLVLIQAEAFREAIATDHALCLAVLGCQAAQFRRQIKLAKNLKLRSAEERVGCYLLGLVQEATPNVPVRLPMEKRLIAWQLGMTRETFSRILAGMERYGLRISGDIDRGRGRSPAACALSAGPADRWARTDRAVSAAAALRWLRWEPMWP